MKSSIAPYAEARKKTTPISVLNAAPDGDASFISLKQ